MAIGKPQNEERAHVSSRTSFSACNIEKLGVACGRGYLKHIMGKSSGADPGFQVGGVNSQHVINYVGVATSPRKERKL